MNPTSAGGQESETPGRRIFIVDDHPLMRDGMGHLINSEPGLIFCGGAGTAEDALSEVARLKPDLVITDVSLPGRSGLDLIKDLKARAPEVLVLAFSMHDENYYAERALRAGARGYLMKGAGSEKMLEAIHRILAGETLVSPAIAAKILDHFSSPHSRHSNSRIEKLTDREFEVFEMIGRGKTTGEVSDNLQMSPKTVAVHRANIKQKLGIASGTELMRHAVRWVETQSSENQAAP
jgi:DNA-binding NarL/FixJ family response regulator